MGSGTFNTQHYYQAATTYQKEKITTLFQQKQLFADFDPLRVTVRESRASEEHPDPTSIVIACDVTGSMGKIPENLLKGGLGQLMESFIQLPLISNPQVLFAAVGDMECDRVPLQVTQFESDNRIAAQLKHLYLEGGGGGNRSESYHSVWYFAAHKTALDAWKTKRKGILFTMGDELVPPVLKAEHIRKFIDATYTGADIRTAELLETVSARYEVFHLIVQDTQTYQKTIGAENVNACWQDYLGERAILVPTYTAIPEKIIATVRSLCELESKRDKQIAPLPAQSPTPESVPMSAPLFAKLPADTGVALPPDPDAIPHLFICPIAQTVMKTPVMAEDGYTYERESILLWFKQKSTSPMTHQVIGQHVIPNHSLNSEIRQWEMNRGVTSTGVSSSSSSSFNLS